MRIVARLLALALALSAILVSGLPAQAHAVLLSSEPADGAVIAAPPRQITLRFNEAVGPLVLRLIDTTGRPAVLQAAPDGEALVMAAPPQMPNGTYILSYRVVSLDGHPVGGSVLFSVGAPSATPITESDLVSDPAVRAALWAAKIAIYLALFAGIGGAFCLSWLAEPGSRPAGRAILAALIAGLVAIPLSVGLQGADALGLPLPGLASATAWQTGMATSYGLTAVAAAVAIAMALAAMATGSRWGAKPLSLLALIGAGVALALSGHASSADPQWLMRPSVFLHAICIAVWIGALVPLAASLSTGDGGIAMLARFSRTIPVVLIALVLSGTVLAVVQMQKVSAFVTTAYGRVLAAKLAAVLLLLALAAWNRYRLTPMVKPEDGAIRTRLIRSIAIECVVVLAILGLVATWRFTPPPRALAIAAAQPFFTHIHTSKAMADVEFTPGRAGPIAVRAVLMREDFSRLDAKSVRLALENPAAGVEPIIRTAQKAPDGSWRIPDLLVPLPGRWKLTLDVLIDDFDKAALDTDIELRR